MITKISGWMKGFLFQEEGGKRVLNKKNTGILVSFLLMLGICGSLIPSLFSNPDSSVIRRSDVPIVKSQATSQGSQNTEASNQVVGGVKNSTPQRKPARLGKAIAIKYRAKQVLAPKDGSEKISIGTNFIGKLLTDVDTRFQQLIQVTLPYGGSDRNGTGSLPPGTILYGQTSYPGHGEKVYMNFDRGVLPDGQEIQIQARVLSSKDYSPGVIGEFHSNTGTQMASAMGLSMMSGVTEILIEKESLGNTLSATPKATIKNGIYNGLSKVAEAEANRKFEKLAEEPDYVTIIEGSDIIISLISSYQNGNGQ